MSTTHSIDLSHVLRPEHENKWVALSADHTRVLTVADHLSELVQQTKLADAVFHRVLPANVTFAP